MSAKPELRNTCGLPRFVGREPTWVERASILGGPWWRLFLRLRVRWSWIAAARSRGSRWRNRWHRTRGMHACPVRVGLVVADRSK